MNLLQCFRKSTQQIITTGNKQSCLYCTSDRQNDYKNLIGMNIPESEGANFWLSVLTD